MKAKACFEILIYGQTVTFIILSWTRLLVQIVKHKILISWVLIMVRGTIIALFMFEPDQVLQLAKMYLHPALPSMTSHHLFFPPEKVSVLVGLMRWQ